MAFATFCRLLLLLWRLFYEIRSATSLVLDECWADHDFAALFSNETCHAAWRSSLETSRIISVDNVEVMLEPVTHKLGLQNGAIRLHFEDDRLAMFKVCSNVRGINSESFKAEAFVYAIDRTFHFHRTPPVVMRVAEPFKLKFGGTQRNIRDALTQVQVFCQDDRKTFFGTLMGWTRFPLTVMHGYSQKLPPYFFEYNLEKGISQHQIEFSRLLMLLFLTGEPHKMDHNIMTFVGNYNLDAEHMFIVAADNDRGDWQRHSVFDVILLQGERNACEREPHAKVFRCPHFGNNSTKPDMRHVHNYLETACIFPREVAVAVEQFSRSKNERPGAVVEQFVEDMEQRGLRDSTLKFSKSMSVLSFLRWNATTLNERVRHLARLIDRCVYKFGREQVLFDGRYKMTKSDLRIIANAAVGRPVSSKEKPNGPPQAHQFLYKATTRPRSALEANLLKF